MFGDVDETETRNKIEVDETKTRNKLHYNV